MATKDYSANMNNAATEEEWQALKNARSAKEATMKTAGTWNYNWTPTEYLTNPFQGNTSVSNANSTSTTYDPAQGYIDALKGSQNDDITLLKNAAAQKIATQKANLEPTYYAAKNQAIGSSEKSARSLAEYMANRGLTGSGEGVQAELSRNNTLNGQLYSLDLEKRQAAQALDDQLMQNNAEYDAQAIQRSNSLLDSTINYLRNQYNVDREYNYNKERDTVADQRYQNEWDYNVQQDEYQKALNELANYGKVKTQAAAKALGVPVGTTSLEYDVSQQSSRGSGSSSGSSYKPRLTSDQTKEAIYEGKINDETKAAYRYWFGEDYKGDDEDDYESENSTSSVDGAYMYDKSVLLSTLKRLSDNGSSKELMAKQLNSAYKAEVISKDEYKQLAQHYGII